MQPNDLSPHMPQFPTRPWASLPLKHLGLQNGTLTQNYCLTSPDARKKGKKNKASVYKFFWGISSTQLRNVDQWGQRRKCRSIGGPSLRKPEEWGRCVPSRYLPSATRCCGFQGYNSKTDGVPADVEIPF